MTNCSTLYEFDSISIVERILVCYRAGWIRSGVAIYLLEQTKSYTAKT